MEQQHPIPQQISSYQFRLVGDMTLKQFFQIGGGALVSLLIYATGLHPLIKWPLIIISFSLGAALAFLPFQERPLSMWIFSFFRSIYSPTIYVWKRSDSIRKFFQEETAPQQTPTTPLAPINTPDYLKGLPDQKTGFLARLDNAEQTLLSKFSGLFSGLGPPGTVAEEIKQSEKPIVQPKNIPINYPQPKPVSVASKGFRPKIVIEEKPLAEKVQKDVVSQTNVSPTLTPDEIKSQLAKFSPEASPPYPATIPNTIVGQVVDLYGKIIEGAILEIKDLAGRPVRALRSNKVGHFIIVTALPKGHYTITTEKEGYEFDPVSFEAKGEIIPSILIRAKNSLEDQKN